MVLALVSLLACEVDVLSSLAFFLASTCFLRKVNICARNNNFIPQRLANFANFQSTDVVHVRLHHIITRSRKLKISAAHATLLVPKSAHTRDEFSHTQARREVELRRLRIVHSVDIRGVRISADILTPPGHPQTCRTCYWKGSVKSVLS